MASGGQPPPASHLSKTWADVAAAAQRKPPSSLLVDGPMLNKLKANMSEFLQLDCDTISRARQCFQSSLYGKFYGKSPPFEQVKEILSSKWNDLGSYQISDLPNGCLLIRCGTMEAMQRLLFEGPWAVNSNILQLGPWQPFFEPAFMKLSTAAIWIQLYNFPVEFWDGESLESISSLLGRLLKIDDFTSSMSRSKYAWICIEIDLAKPLKQGFWLGDDGHRVFVVVLYERIPIFCYKCGLIRHGSNNYSHRSFDGPEHPLPPHCNDLGVRQRQEVRGDSDIMSEGMEAWLDSRPEDSLGGYENFEESPKTKFGPWMLVMRRRGHGGGRGGAGGSAGSGSRAVHVSLSDLDSHPPNVSIPRSSAAWATHDGGSLRGRGGSAVVRTYASRAFNAETASSLENAPRSPPCHNCSFENRAREYHASGW